VEAARIPRQRSLGSWASPGPAPFLTQGGQPYRGVGDVGVEPDPAALPAIHDRALRTVRQESHVILRITAVIASPIRGSAIGSPSATTAALATTARLT
jgi:hypothetical protein